MFVVYHFILTMKNTIKIVCIAGVITQRGYIPALSLSPVYRTPEEKSSGAGISTRAQVSATSQKDCLCCFKRNSETDKAAILGLANYLTPAHEACYKPPMDSGISRDTLTIQNSHAKQESPKTKHKFF